MRNTATVATTTDHTLVGRAFGLVRVQSHSMAPTLRDGQLLFVRRRGLNYRLRRGDIVVAHSAELGRLVVKRIIGLPGEVIGFRDGAVSIDGLPLSEPYAGRSAYNNSFAVPSGHYLLLGDNRDASSDSRSWREPYLARAEILGTIVRPGRADHS